MNKERRKLIARAQELIREACTILEVARTEEQEYYENMPPAFQESEKGQKAEEDADKLCEVVDILDEIDLSDLYS